MKTYLLQIIGAIFLTILALMGLGAALHVFLTLPMGPKGPEWVAAIGTVGTLIGTIWIATAQARAKRREQLATAIVAAADCMVRARNVVRSLAQVVHELSNPHEQPDDPKVGLGMCLRKLDERNLWTMGDIVPLVVLPKQTAANLAWVRAQVLSTRAELEKVIDVEQLFWNDVDLYVHGLIYHLNVTREAAERAHAECAAFLVKQGFQNAVPVYQRHHDTAREERQTVADDATSHSST